MVNVIPLDDLKIHTLDTTCDCCPQIQFLTQMLIVHNSFDNRELQEHDGIGIPNKHWKIVKEEEIP